MTGPVAFFGLVLLCAYLIVALLIGLAVAQEFQSDDEGSWLEFVFIIVMVLAWPIAVLFYACSRCTGKKEKR